MGSTRKGPILEGRLLLNLALGGGHGPFILEKWYIDTLLPDGGVVLVYLGRMRVFGYSFARVTADLLSPEGMTRRGSASARRIAGGPDWLDFGPARIKDEELSFETPGLSARLGFSPRHPPVTLREPFLTVGRRRLTWTVEIPDADVVGELSWPGGALSVVGRGYRDRVFFDIPPWRFPIRRLEWGRAVASAHAATWVSAETRAETIAAAWQDGEMRTRSALEVGLTEGRVLLDAAVVDLEGLGLGPMRPLLRWLTRDPHQVKRAAAATVAGDPGRAIFEEVRWR